MKKHFNVDEKKWSRYWQKEKIYKFQPKKNQEIYSIDTPPPTLSGKMHIGHAFSYTQQDIIARYQRMRNKSVFYPFGTDDNGLATEKLVEKENKIRIFDIGRKDFIKLCQKTIKKLRPDFIKDWKDIGMSCDFSLEYSTISQEVQKISQAYFIDLYKKNRVYRKKSPTIWCPVCQTAIAQAEMEDKEKQSFFNEISFKVNQDEIIIATTRPELLASCVALFVHPSDKRFKKFLGKQALVPIFNQKVKIMQDKLVDPEKGTGAVMCCTFGDLNDIEWFLGYNLDLRISINNDGKLNELAGPFQGLSINQAREKIIEELKKRKQLIKQEQIKHTVNVHERCGTAIEIIPTKQWFIKYLDLKKEFLKMGDKLSWTPLHFKSRYSNWVKNLKWDWCISRQRYFGVPFPVWYCQHCQKEVLAKKSDLPIDPIQTKPKAKCCGKNDFIPEKDVFDTWATSALTPQISQSLIKNKIIRKKIWPMSLRPQAHDIINFWLFYTLARSKIHFNKLPWQKTVISGFVLDEKGEKMSKSKGNVVDPREIISKYSADALRYWASGIGFGEDLRWSEKEVNNGRKLIIKISNIFKFSMIHLKNYQPSKKTKFEPEDEWILSKLEKTLKNYLDCFEKYQYQKARKLVDSFFWNDFCANYIEMIKSRLYNKKRNFSAALFVLYHCLFEIIKLYACFIPFLTEEIYQQYFKKFNKEKSVHLTKLSQPNKKLFFSQSEKNIDQIIEIIQAIRKFKSENNLALSQEISLLEIETKQKDIEKYFEMIKDVLSIKEIKINKGNIKVNKIFSIKISV
jgi:valyl-tRNA synthetase